MVLLQVAFIFLTPALFIYVVKRNAALEVLGPVLLCYIAGIAVANQPFLPVDEAISNTLTEAMVPLAIPLLLFSTDIRGWLRHGGSAVGSFLLATLSVLVSSFVGAQLFQDRVEEFWKIAGMLVGVYTGGTPNLLSIGMALEVSEETFILLNASDVLVGGAYLLFLLTLAMPILGRFLRPFDLGAAKAAQVDQGGEAPSLESRPITKQDVKEGALGLGLSVLILGVSAGLSQLIFGALPPAPVIFGLTTLGILASLVPKIHALKASDPLGNYLILVFCVAIGTLTDLSQLMSASSDIFTYTAVVITGAILLHYALAALFRIDRDTTIITSVAAVFGPAFVAPIAKKLNNPYVLLSGLTTGLVGYAVGNYLGLALAYWLKP